MQGVGSWTTILLSPVKLSTVTSFVTPVFEYLSKDEFYFTAASRRAPDAKTVRATELLHRQAM
jgi:hypothetical protein